MTAETPRAVSVAEAARMLSLSKQTVYQQIREGRLRKLPLVGTGAVRVTVASIEALLADAAKVAS